MKSIKSFFNMVWAEVKMLCRNKALLIILLSMSLLILLIMSIFATTKSNISIGMFLDGIDAEESGVYEIIMKNVNVDEMIYVDSNEQGKDLIARGEVTIFVSFNSETDPATATIFYDSTSIVGNTIRGNIMQLQNKYAYTKITELLNKYGFKVDNDYFHPIKLAPGNANPASWTQSVFSIELGVCISAVLMIGIAYSTSRNFETSVNKNLAYLPVGANRSLLSKIVPYFSLGFIEMAILITIGTTLFKITYLTSFLEILGISIFFILACLTTGLMFGMSKSQLTAVLLDLIMILLPLLMTLSNFSTNLPFYIQYILYLSPLYPFSFILNGMMFDGIVLWNYVLILVAQIIVYYLIALFIYKRKSRA